VDEKFLKSLPTEQEKKVLAKAKANEQEKQIKR